MNLEQWHIDTIKQAFTACYGLQNCINKQLPQSIETLSKRTGFRVSFIQQNINQIIAL